MTACSLAPGQELTEGHCRELRMEKTHLKVLLDNLYRKEGSDEWMKMSPECRVELGADIIAVSHDIDAIDLSLSTMRRVY